VSTKEINTIIHFMNAELLIRGDTNGGAPKFFVHRLTSHDMSYLVSTFFRIQTNYLLFLELNTIFFGFLIGHTSRVF
jgi:hypothetical protein